MNMNFFYLYEALTGLLFLVGLFLLVWFNKVSIDSLTRGIELLNTRGGNILLLLIATIIGSFASLRLFYYVIQLSVDGKISQDNVFTIMGLTFVTGTITGNFQGALLKTMTGDASNGVGTRPLQAEVVAPKPPVPPGA